MISDVSRAVIAALIVTPSLVVVATAGEPDLFTPTAGANLPASDGSTPMGEYSPVPVPPAPAAGESPQTDDPALVVPPAAAPVAANSPALAACGVAAYPVDPACRYCGRTDCRNAGIRFCYGTAGGAYDSHCCSGPPGYVKTPILPVGSRMHAIMGWQISRGQAALQVLHNFDFIPGAKQLSVRGRRELVQIARRCRNNNHPIIIEATPYRPKLARARWDYVAAALAELPVPVDPSRLIVASPPGRPAEGRELLLLYNGFLGMARGASQARSTSGSLGSFPGGAAGGGGLGGAGGAGGGFGR